MSKNQILTVFFILLGVVLFGWNHILDLRGEEPRRAVVAIEMILSGEYLAPKIHGWYYYNKPPVFNWVLAGFMHLLSSFEEWVVRMPSIISFLITGWALFKYSKPFIGRETAMLSAVLFYTAGDLLYFGTIYAGEIDLFFGLISVIQIGAIFYGLEKRNYWTVFGVSYLFAAIGTLTKGPPSIAFQVLTLIPYLFYKNQWKKLFHIAHFLGILLFVILVVGYFILYDQQNDGWGFAARLIKEASQKTGLESQWQSTLIGTLTFPVFLLKILAPWSLFAFLLLIKKVRQAIWTNSLTRFCVIFFICNIPLYWIASDHKARYIYMFFPFVTLILASSITYVRNNRTRLYTKINQSFLWIAGLVTTSIFILPFFKESIPVSQLALRSISIGLLAGLVFFLMSRYKTHRIYLFATFLLVIRLGMNIIYLPAMKNDKLDTSVKEDIKELTILLEDTPIRLGGYPYEIESTLALGGRTLFSVEHEIPPHLPYSIPYYLLLYTNTVMVYDKSAKDGIYYIVSKGNEKRLRIVYEDELGANWLNGDWKLGVKR